MQSKTSYIFGKGDEPQNNFHALEDSFDIAIRQQMKNG
jgi:hypothetical protein